MRNILHSDILWQFLGGFALGAIALVSLHPGQVAHSIDSHFATQPHYAG